MMSVSDLIEPRKFKVGGAIVTAIVSAASAPGNQLHDEQALNRFLDCQPSGCEHALKYWDGFTPLETYDNAAVPTSFCGSGGDGSVAKLIRIIESNVSDRSDSDNAVLQNCELIATIRSALSLQIKELAEILRVQRPTIYSWIKDEVEPSATNRERLQTLYRVAAIWNQVCNLPAGKLVRGVGTDGRSILDLLKEEDIDEHEVERRFRQLAPQRQRIKSEADTNRPSTRTITQRHELTHAEVADQQHVVDAETGKRSSPD